MPITASRPMCRTTPLSGTALTVAAPSSPRGRQAARKLCDALAQCGRMARLLDNPAAAAMRKAAGPVLVIGNLAESRCVEHLYDHLLAASDYWYPGPGGYELRTLMDPFATGHNIIHIGYSDAAGLAAAMAALVPKLDAQELPHLLEIHATRYPMRQAALERLRSMPVPDDPIETANSRDAARKGYVYYLTGDEDAGRAFRRFWDHLIALGYDKSPINPQPHLMSQGWVLNWWLAEHVGLFDPDRALAILRYLHGWAESPEGWPYVMHCPRAATPHMPRQNHELFPALALTFLADYFELHLPGLPSTARWRRAAEQLFEPYTSSWKPLCDGLVHGWFLSVPATMLQALRDPGRPFFEAGGARRAADCAVAVVNNDGWMPHAGDGDIAGRFPAAVLRTASAYYQDGRYAFALARAPEGLWLGDFFPARAFDKGVAPVEPDTTQPVTAVPVDPLLYDCWQRDPAHAYQAVNSPPSAPIDRCFDKLAVRTGWGRADDYLLLDGIAGGSHSYDDALAVLDYARLAVSMLISADGANDAEPERHTMVTVTRDGETAPQPGFAYVEAQHADDAGNVYLRLRLDEYAGADWLREVYLCRCRCLVLRDTVRARREGLFVVEAHFWTPGRMERSGAGVAGARRSPLAGPVTARLESTCLREQLDMQIVPLGRSRRRRHSTWSDRYYGAEPVLTCMTARRAAHLAEGEAISMTHLAQVQAPTEPELHAIEADGGFGTQGGAVAEAPKPPAVRANVQPRDAVRHLTSAAPLDIRPWHEAGDVITAMQPLPSGGLCVGTAAGRLQTLDAQSRPAWSATLSGPVHDVGLAADMLVAGHGERGVSAFDRTGQPLWEARIERIPCPWPWWELETPAPVRVVGLEPAAEALFAVGCGDIQVRCFGGDGALRWCWRYDEGVPARIEVLDVPGWGPMLAVGGDIRSDQATVRLVHPDGRLLGVFPVEGWTSRCTAMDAALVEGRLHMACGASRGANLHLFDISKAQLAPTEDRVEASEPLSLRGGAARCWMKRLGGQVVGACLVPAERTLVAGTSKGVLLAYRLDGTPAWSVLLDGPVTGLVQCGDGIVAATSGDGLALVDPGGRRIAEGALGHEVTTLRVGEGVVWVSAARGVFRVPVGPHRRS